MPRNKINYFWACQFEDENGDVQWRLISATTRLGAERRAFEIGFNRKLRPKYETIRVATSKEVASVKKKIKDKVRGASI